MFGRSFRSFILDKGGRCVCTASRTLRVLSVEPRLRLPAYFIVKHNFFEPNRVWALPRKPYPGHGRCIGETCVCTDSRTLRVLSVEPRLGLPAFFLVKHNVFEQNRAWEAASWTWVIHSETCVCTDSRTLRVLSVEPRLELPSFFIVKHNVFEPNRV